MDVGLLLLAVGGILAVSVVVALGAARVGVPFLVVFLGLGMLLGSDGPVGINFDDVELARTVGIVGLAAILFEGGLSSSWQRLRQVAVPASLLSTVGVAATAGLTGIAAHLLFGLPWLQSILLGAVVSSTDAAAVFATLRTTTIRRRLARVLEAETGLNDPVAIALTLGLISWIQHPQSGFAELAVELVRQLGLGLVMGVGFAAGAAWLFARLPESIGAFAPVASVATAAIAFGATDLLGAVDSSPSTLSGSPSVAPRRVTDTKSWLSMKDWPSWRKSPCSSSSACSSSLTNSERSPLPPWP